MDWAGEGSGLGHLLLNAGRWLGVGRLWRQTGRLIGPR